MRWRVKLLNMFHIATPPDLTQGEAGQLINECMRRKNARLCTPKQAKWLKRCGFNPEMPMVKAKKIMDVIANNNWHWPQAHARPNFDGDWGEDAA